MNSWGPSRIRVTKNDAQIFVDDTLTAVEYDDVDFDNLGEYNNTTFRFTATDAGHYLINAKLLTANVAWTIDDTLRFLLQKNGAGVLEYLQRTEMQAAITAYVYLQGTVIISLASGDYFQVLTQITRGGNTACYVDASFNCFEIHRLS